MVPHLVILAIPMAVKVTVITPWIHHSWMKKAADPNYWQAICDPTNLFKLKFQRMSQQNAIARECSSPAPATSQNTLWKPEDLPASSETLYLVSQALEIGTNNSLQ
jgi:hypothetical protein